MRGLTMSNAQQEYHQIAEEAKENHLKITALIEKNEKVAKHYKGSQVLFSPFIENPTILLMGINPGSGYYKQTKGERVAQFLPLDKLEYFTNDYTLAKETRNAFEKAGLLHLLVNSTVKSNVYYTATDNTSTLWALVSSLCSEKVNDPETAALEWTRRLVKVIAPKVVICEGCVAFQEFSKAITGKKKYFRGSKTTKQQVGDYTVLAYSRKINSGIADTKAFVQLLSETFG